MRLMVFFDLPVGTSQQRRSATAFRNWLLKDGYYMLQFSVYVRICNGPEAAEAHLNRMLKIAPTGGSVRSMLVTERQYANIKLISGEKKDFEENAQNLTNIML